MEADRVIATMTLGPDESPFWTSNIHRDWAKPVQTGDAKSQSL
jgi:hypothetical protein